MSARTLHDGFFSLKSRATRSVIVGVTDMSADNVCRYLTTVSANNDGPCGASLSCYWSGATVSDPAECVISSNRLL